MGVLSYLKKPSAFLWRAFSPSRESPETGENESPPEVWRKGSQETEPSTTASPLVIQVWELNNTNKQRAEFSTPPVIPGQRCERAGERLSCFVTAVNERNHVTSV